MRSSPFQSVFLLLVLSTGLIPAASISAHYKIENIPLPAGLDPQVGALAVTPSGKLIAAFPRGEVLSYDPMHQHWHPFTFGWHEPLDMLAISDREVLVMQRPELTRLIDTDGLKPGYVYEFTCKGIRGADSEELINTLVCYTCNRLRDGSAPEPQIPGTGPKKKLKEKDAPDKK